MRRDPLPRRVRSSVLVALACSASLAFGLTACGSNDTARPDASESGSPSTPSSSPVSTAVAATDAAVAQATQAVHEYYATTGELLSDPARPLDRAASVASGQELDLLRRQVQEQRIKGLRQTGTVRLTKLTVTSADLKQPATVTIDTCADVSAVDVRDASGVSAIAPDRPTASLVHLTVVESAGVGWRVEETSARGEPCTG